MKIHSVDLTDKDCDKKIINNIADAERGNSLAGCGKSESVMLSAAKHLLNLIENKPKQILRAAQDDMVRRLFPQTA